MIICEHGDHCFRPECLKAFATSERKANPRSVAGRQKFRPSIQTTGSWATVITKSFTLDTDSVMLLDAMAEYEGVNRSRFLSDLLRAEAARRGCTV